MSFENFCRCWNTTHAGLVTSVPQFTGHVRRYVQSHVVQDYSGADDHSKLTNQWRLAPFDGIAELWFDDAADVIRAFNEPAFIEMIAPHDEHLVDQAGTRLMVVQEIEKFPNLAHRYGG